MHLYKYDYGNIFKKFTSLFFSCFELVFGCLFFLFIIVLLCVLCINWFSDNSIIKYFFVVLGVIIHFCILLYFLKIALRKDGVILENNKIVIRRKFSYHFKYTYQVNYEDIEVCQKYDGEIISSCYRELYNFPVLWFNWDNVAIIVDKNKSEYYLPICSADDFIAEVNARVKQYKFFSELNIDNLLIDKSGKKLNYSDLKIRWKSADEIDSIYYTDDSGNKIELIKY